MMTKKAKRVVTQFLSYLLMIFAALLMIAPFLWMLSTSLKVNTELFRIPLQWIPKNPRWANYQDVLDAVPFFGFMGNSLFVATVVTLLQLVACAMGAYAFARMRFPGRDKIFLAYLATMMVPSQVTIIPMYLLFSSLKLIDSYWALIIPGIFSAYGTFLMRQFFFGIPMALEESVRIDGGGYWTCFLRIVIPLSKPAFAALGTFTFLANWNNFLWPLLCTNRVSMKTLPVGITYFMGQYSIQWQMLMAAVAMSIVPMLIIYLFLQKYFVAGIALTGMKS